MSDRRYGKALGADAQALFEFLLSRNVCNLSTLDADAAWAFVRDRIVAASTTNLAEPTSAEIRRTARGIVAIYPSGPAGRVASELLRLSAMDGAPAIDRLAPERRKWRDQFDYPCGVMDTDGPWSGELSRALMLIDDLAPRPSGGKP